MPKPSTNTRIVAQTAAAAIAAGAVGDFASDASGISDTLSQQFAAQSAAAGPDDGGLFNNPTVFGEDPDVNFQQWNPNNIPSDYPDGIFGQNLDYASQQFGNLASPLVPGSTSSFSDFNGLSSSYNPAYDSSLSGLATSAGLAAAGGNVSFAANQLAHSQPNSGPIIGPMSPWNNFQRLGHAVSKLGPLESSLGLQPVTGFQSGSQVGLQGKNKPVSAWSPHSFTIPLKAGQTTYMKSRRRPPTNVEQPVARSGETFDGSN